MESSGKEADHNQRSRVHSILKIRLQGQRKTKRKERHWRGLEVIGEHIPRKVSLGM